jgi:hypothetical protein
MHSNERGVQSIPSDPRPAPGTQWRQPRLVRLRAGFVYAFGWRQLAAIGAICLAAAIAWWLGASEGATARAEIAGFVLCAALLRALLGPQAPARWLGQLLLYGVASDDAREMWREALSHGRFVRIELVEDEAAKARVTAGYGFTAERRQWTVQAIKDVPGGKVIVACTGRRPRRVRLLRRMPVLILEPLARLSAS